MPSLPPSVLAALAPLVGRVTSAQPLAGGDTAQAARVETGSGTVFVKWLGGEAGAGVGMEADGLAALAAVAGPDLVVPAPLGWADADGSTPGWLVLPWIAPGRPSRSGWARFGAALAALHRAPAPGPPGAPYGWARDNWIGTKPQRNGWAASWPAFFGEQRLRAQAEVVRRRGAWDARWDAPLDALVRRLPDVLPAAPPPSVLHGDLWAGNALPTADGRFALVDPAVSVGDREADLAMTRLFGGFDRAFYDGYREAWPLDAGWEERTEIYALVHRINHLTHGPGYAAGVEAVLVRFGQGRGPC